ncbi:MOSC domain-containing protein [Aquimarina sp. 2201CG14-23]|uniref:MOSC domain-containing protein n=1 Tax=Aquimarina mycalae TaxID=3040073 RepID=UPI0024781E5A|nr:MOSC domain-containing protein [Aquimarina sp. 2201CG14-23]MDH7446535.1 MOSC domain-containing protein [Aquimarina sp. 2201CG14-23]
MKVISTNIGMPKTISWRGKDVKTGIYKYPVDKPIFLDREDVEGDHVVDRKVHGGIDKACYLYSANHYPFWKEKYPDLEWNYGMFGENLTVEGFDERNIKIGAIYKLGSATVQISRPRQPCYKLGIKFGTQKILKQFIDSLFPGVYVRILQPGVVNTKDEFTLIEDTNDGVSVSEIYTLIYHYDKSKHADILSKALNNNLVSDSDKKYFRKHQIV